MGTYSDASAGVAMTLRRGKSRHRRRDVDVTAQRLAVSDEKETNMGTEEQTETQASVQSNDTSISVAFSNTFSKRTTPAHIHAAHRDGKLRIWITGFDLSNFESVVGSRRAARHRAFVGLGSDDLPAPRSRRILARTRPRVRRRK